MPDDVALFAELPLFASLSGEELTMLAGMVQTRILPAGSMLFRAGDPGTTMYVVASGAIEIFVTDRAGQKIVLTECRKGDAFGELAMLDTGPRTATAVAMDVTELVELDRENVLQLVSRKPESALHMLGAMGAMTRKADMLLRTRVARNAQEEIEDHRSRVEKLTDWIANFSGSMAFLALNAAWFAMWIVLNVTGRATFDPYPFGLLTMIVSLEAIILSILVLLAQNRQTAKDHIRDDVEYEINVKAELEIAHLHEKVEEMTEQLRERLDRIQAVVDESAKRATKAL